MAFIVGYKVVFEVSCFFFCYFLMMIIVVGSICLVMVLVFGVGVVGLQAIVMAWWLGVQVEVFDICFVVKEEVKSFGVKFIEIEGVKEDMGVGGYVVEQFEEFLKW